MNKILTVVALASAILSATGCAPKPPSQVEVSSANYGSLPSDYRQQITNYMAASLKDPESARYTFQPTFKGYSQDGSLATNGGRVLYGYVAPVLVNAKNSYGGYTGNHQYVFMFSNGVIYDTTLNYMYGRVKPVN